MSREIQFARWQLAHALLLVTLSGTAIDRASADATHTARTHRDPLRATNKLVAPASRELVSTAAAILDEFGAIEPKQSASGAVDELAGPQDIDAELLELVDPDADWDAAEDPAQTPEVDAHQLGLRPSRPRAEAAGRFVIIPTTSHAMSIGSPSAGRLRNGTQLPRNPALYTIRDPQRAWCSSRTAESLQRALASFRTTTGYIRPIWILDASGMDGGYLPPHVSHQQGRDVDIRLPIRPGPRPRSVPIGMALVDWDATWKLIRSFAATGAVKYIFLSRPRQLELYRAAKRAGATDREIKQYLQHPHGSRFALVRHSKGHERHFHVRFLCAPSEKQCRD